MERTRVTFLLVLLSERTLKKSSSSENFSVEFNIELVLAAILFKQTSNLKTTFNVTKTWIIKAIAHKTANSKMTLITDRTYSLKNIDTFKTGIKDHGSFISAEAQTLNLRSAKWC